jgi:hypothetical protein
MRAKKKERETYLIRLVSQSIGSLRLEESVIGVEHLSCENSEPFSSDSSCVDTFFVVELDVELSMFDLVSRFALENVERIFENVSSSDVEVDRRVVSSLPLRAVVKAREEELRTRRGSQYRFAREKLIGEKAYRSLILKVEHRRVPNENRERTRHERRIVANHRVENLRVSRRELDELGRGRVGELVDDEKGFDERE